MPHKSYKKLVIILSALAALFFAGTVTSFAERLPQLELLNEQGKPAGLNLRNGLNVVAVLRPECRDCVTELPILKKLVQDYHLQASLIVYGKDSTALPDYEQKFSVPGTQYFADPRKLTRAAFDMHYIPFILFFDCSGEILGEYESGNGAFTYQELVDIVRQLDGYAARGHEKN